MNNKTYTDDVIERMKYQIQNEPDAYLTPNFRAKEFACKMCLKAGVYYNVIKPELVLKLQDVRNILGVPIIITSGCRCKKHNQEIGGASKSFHLSGEAVDVYSPRLAITNIYLVAEKNGFNGIGTYPEEGFVHLDIGNRYSRWTQQTIDGIYRYVYII